MKQFKFYSFASALLLASAVGLGSCSSDSDVVENGGGIAGQTVKTQFAINIPYAKGDSNNAKASTRMTEDNTQGNGNNFLGIENMSLLTFSDNARNVGSTISSYIDLGSTSYAASTSTDKKSQLYRDIAIPIGTSDFVFYGRAPRTSNSSDAKFNNGYLAINGVGVNSKQTSNISFNLETVLSGQNVTNITETEDAKNIITQLNTVLHSKGRTTASPDNDVAWYTLSLTQTTTEDNMLSRLYNTFSKLQAGSANTVINTLRGLQNETSGESHENSLLKAINKNCETAIKALEGNNFPTGLNLPEGIAKISCNEYEGEGTPEFKYVANKNITGMSEASDYEKICYPASLAYFVATKAMVSTQALNSVSELPTYEEWTGTNATSVWTQKGFTQGTVGSSTKTVSLKDAIQYGVANLKVSVKCKDSQLTDNSAAITGIATPVNVPNGGFKVTGILVGGQPSQVGWDFTPNKDDEKFDYTIFDKKMNGENFSATYNGTNAYNYTLVLDNKKKTGEQDVVYVALELQNGSTPFYAAQGIIPSGGTFYLVGKLDLNSNTGVTKPTTGEGQEAVDHIFVKDHTTTANFTISSLESAYNYIPDLRSSLLSFGMAVDLSWQEGVKFDVNIGE